MIARVDLAHEANFVIGAIEIRPSRRELVGEGFRQTIDPRVMRVLVALARAKSEILSRDDLIESCWDGVIVGDDAINRCISRLRKVAESCGNAFAVETVPRVGYRLIPPETALAEARAEIVLAEPGETPATQPPFSAAPQASRKKHALMPLVAAGLALVLIAGAGLWWFLPRPSNNLSASSDPPAGPANSVAVLPFANMSGDRAREYFSDGISEELISELSANPELRVIARTSAFAFKGKNADAKTVAHSLGVRSLVEGSVRETGDRVRINVQLIDSGSGYSVWSGTYDRNLTEIFALQNEIARAIAHALTNRTLPQTAGSSSGVVNADAYRAYLKGSSYYALRTEEGALKAAALFEKAAALQPDFADALAALASTYIFLEDHGTVYNVSYYSRAQELLNRALKIAPDNLHVLACHLSLSIDLLDWGGAIADAHRIQKINAHGVAALRAIFYYHHFLGSPELALKSAREAAELDPLSVTNRSNVIIALISMGRYEETIMAAKEALALRAGQQDALAFLCWAYAHTGQLAQAQRIANTLTTPMSLECMPQIARALGNRAKAEAIIDANVPNVGVSVGYADQGRYYAYGGHYSKAIFWLEKGYEHREQSLFLIPFFDKEIPPEFFKQPDWLALMDKPRMREWKAAHDMIASDVMENGVSE
ncbi:MAG: winged helix-turn-helix domain-containing protein [Rhizomicrobium sp.]